jgi:aminotransferase EvaB
MSLSLGGLATAATSNATDALALALTALGVVAGDEVITVPNTAVPTVTAIYMCGASPRFVDIDPRTQLLDPLSLRGAWTARTKGVIVVHLYGQMVPMAEILSQARTRSAFVLEDCAQAQGAAQAGHLAGTLGDAACFSFYPTKNLGALGDAGLVASRDEQLIARVKMLRNYGMKPGYQHDSYGTNKRMDELQAAYLILKLKKLSWLIKRRQNVAAAYLKGIRHPLVQLPVTAPANSHSYHLFVVRVPKRSDFQLFLTNAGVQTAIHYPKVIPEQRFMVDRPQSQVPLPNATLAASEYVSLPMFPFLKAAEIKRVIKAVNAWPG